MATPPTTTSSSNLKSRPSFLLEQRSQTLRERSRDQPKPVVENDFNTDPNRKTRSFMFLSQSGNRMEDLKALIEQNGAEIREFVETTEKEMHAVETLEKISEKTAKVQFIIKIKKVKPIITASFKLEVLRNKDSRFLFETLIILHHYAFILLIKFDV